MFSLLKFLLTILYFSIFTVAFPSTQQNQDQSPLSSPSANPPAETTICSQEGYLACGTICYDPTEADCDPQFLTLTRFGDYISGLKKAAVEKNKLADEKKSRRVARQRANSIAMRRPPPVVPKPIDRSARKIEYVAAAIPPPPSS
ncbi:hypothetical protein TWF506_004222 [Arthrobotrys conoides]|uniref:Uncharacterized protein n=1 Tax=Arthrobotrys conoides TaxID=74498 RepID=A0AAN8RPE5_9PEZI